MIYAYFKIWLYLNDDVQRIIIKKLPTLVTEIGHKNSMTSPNKLGVLKQVKNFEARVIYVEQCPYWITCVIYDWRLNVSVISLTQKNLFFGSRPESRYC